MVLFLCVFSHVYFMFNHSYPISNYIQTLCSLRVNPPGDWGAPGSSLLSSIQLTLNSFDPVAFS